MKWFVIFTFILSSILVVHAKSDTFYQKLKSSPGLIELTQGTLPSCANGPFKIVGAAEQETLMVGPNISFLMPHKKSKSSVAPCYEETKSHIDGEKLIMVTSIFNCPKENKSLESRVEETLSFKKNEVIYQRNSNQQKSSECRFKWIPRARN